MRDTLIVGIKGRQCEEVVPENTAGQVGSGLLAVYATPAMAAIMEKTAAVSVEEHLDEGEATVGISINIKHTSASPIGMHISCESELVEIDRKRLVFSVKCFDEAGPVGEAVHERFVVRPESFLGKLEAKLALVNK